MNATNSLRVLVVAVMIAVFSPGLLLGEDVPDVVWIWKTPGPVKTAYYYWPGVGQTSYVPPFPDSGFQSLEALLLNVIARYSQDGFVVVSRYPGSSKASVIALDAGDLTFLRDKRIKLQD